MQTDVRSERRDFRGQLAGRGDFGDGKISICTWGGGGGGGGVHSTRRRGPHISSHIWISDVKQISITTDRIRPKVRMFFLFKGNASQTLRIIFFCSFHQFPRALPNIFRCVGTIGTFRNSQSQCFTSSLNNIHRRRNFGARSMPPPLDRCTPRNVIQFMT